MSGTYKLEVQNSKPIGNYVSNPAEGTGTGTGPNSRNSSGSKGQTLDNLLLGSQMTDNIN
jgi:hypothetical protein